MSKRLDIHGTFTHGGARYDVRPVEARDIETLRVWKNENREFFHHRDVIEPEQQKRWFASFSAAPDRQITVLEAASGLAACVGYRELSEDRVELFNLLRGDGRSRSGLMHIFFEFTVDALRARGIRQIELDVVVNNPRAVSWYARQGFVRVDEAPTHLRMHRSLSTPVNAER